MEDSGILFPMEKKREQLIEAIQSSGHKAALVVAGGGSGAVEELLSHPGASRFVLEVQIPYSVPALRDYLGESPESFCSEDAARLLAERAYERALILGDEASILGIACTAALQTNRERKGADRAFFAVKSRKRLEVCSLDLDSGSRYEQEEAVSTALLGFISGFLGVGE